MNFTSSKQKCPYCDHEACKSLLEFLRDNSYTLAEHTKKYFCEDNFRRCARFQTIKNGSAPNDLGRLTPWDKLQSKHQPENQKQSRTQNNWSKILNKRSDAWTSPISHIT